MKLSFRGHFPQHALMLWVGMLILIEMMFFNDHWCVFFGFYLKAWGGNFQ